MDWWLTLRGGHNSLRQNGIDSVVMLVVWSLWKERNNRVFDNAPTLPDVAWLTWSTTSGRRGNYGHRLGQNGWRLSAGLRWPQTMQL
ncbi:hypothetical protein HU200_020534 [Digitaria exilis]|uniref:Uncharacterized protein n=1 Tax=Digitaria exilis TaxID=1010633 RepID=A0A835F206_9POAL|nr:hypothetical protein HU200_020534 [Digitaria exilis]